VVGAGCTLAGLDEYAAGAGGASTQGGGGTSTQGGGGASPTTGAGGATSPHDAGAGGADPEGGPPPADGGACDDGVVCGGACVDPSSDPANCGGCGRACAPGYGCLEGVCGNVPVHVATSQLSCAVLRGGEVWCWGRNVLGEAGFDPALSDSTCPFYNDRCQVAPRKVAGLLDAVEVEVGVEAACARTRAGEIYCWGSNQNGLLGHDPTGDDLCERAGGPGAGTAIPCSPKPQKVPLPAGVTASGLSLGGTVACVSTTSRDVYCWGTNNDGEVKAPPSPLVPTPTKNANVNGDAEEVRLGIALNPVATVCVRRTGTNEVHCWGASNGGALFPTAGVAGCLNGDLCDPVAHAVPETFTPPTGVLVADHLEVGYVSACALRAGIVRCWGTDQYGQSGANGAYPGAEAFGPLPLPVQPVTQISMRSLVTLALVSPGSVYGLGWNDEGAVGDGTVSGAPCPLGNGQSCVNTPVLLGSPANVVKLFAGLDDSAAITADGKVWIWGANYTASLAHAPGSAGDVPCLDGAYVCGPTPTVVAGLP
jgi:hypothetical protein